MHFSLVFLLCLFAHEAHSTEQSAACRKWHSAHAEDIYRLPRKGTRHFCCRRLFPHAAELNATGMNETEDRRRLMFENATSSFSFYRTVRIAALFICTEVADLYCEQGRVERRSLLQSTDSNTATKTGSSRLSDGSEGHHCDGTGEGCSLRRGQVDRFVDDETGVWLVTDAVLDEINSDIQRIIDCTNAGDTLLFDVTKTIKPSAPIIVSRPLTLSAYVENPKLEGGAFPRAADRTAFTCPRENEGLLSIRWSAPDSSPVHSGPVAQDRQRDSGEYRRRRMLIRQLQRDSRHRRRRVWSRRCERRCSIRSLGVQPQQTPRIRRHKSEFRALLCLEDQKFLFPPQHLRWAVRCTLVRR